MFFKNFITSVYLFFHIFATSSIRINGLMFSEKRITKNEAL